MIQPSQSQKYFRSAQRRFLKASIENFFQSEFPQTFGPLICEKIATRLVELIDQQLPHRDHLRPGQAVWNAVSIDTRPDHPNCRFVPVILTLIDSSDVSLLQAGEPMQRIAQRAVARITRQAHLQGGLLSMRDIGLLCWRPISSISVIRKAWEKAHQTVLPHTGSLQDFGSCLTHKDLIVRKVVLERKDPSVVARETGHSQKAVDRYLKNFHQVKTCYDHNSDLDFVCQATGLSRFVVLQYLEIINDLNALSA